MAPAGALDSTGAPATPDAPAGSAAAPTAGAFAGSCPAATGGACAGSGAPAGAAPFAAAGFFAAGGALAAAGAPGAAPPPAGVPAGGVTASAGALAAGGGCWEPWAFAAPAAVRPMTRSAEPTARSIATLVQRPSSATFCMRPSSLQRSTHRDGLSPRGGGRPLALISQEDSCSLRLWGASARFESKIVGQRRCKIRNARVTGPPCARQVSVRQPIIAGATAVLFSRLRSREPARPSLGTFRVGAFLVRSGTGDPRSSRARDSR